MVWHVIEIIATLGLIGFCLLMVGVFFLMSEMAGKWLD